MLDFTAKNMKVEKIVKSAHTAASDTHQIRPALEASSMPIGSTVKKDILQL